MIGSKEVPVSVLLASTDDFRPRRRTYLAALSFFALLGFAVTIGAQRDAWMTLLVGIAALLGALWQVFRRREVRLDAAGGMILVCDSLGAAPAWGRIPL